MASSKIIVLITGGNGGLGFEMVKKLSTEHPDTHHILMGTRSLSKGQEAHKSLGSPSNVTPFQLDITSDESIDAAVKNIESTYSKLDVLINNAGTAGKDLGMSENGTLPPSLSLRQVYTHVYSTNVISAAVMVEKMTPLLTKSALPKVIFISSGLGSIQAMQDRHPGVTVPGGAPIPSPWYNSSKTSMNYLGAYYARVKPEWKVNVVCPGYRATGLNNAQLNEDTDPAKGAVRACQLVLDERDGVSGTYSNVDQNIPW